MGKTAQRGKGKQAAQAEDRIAREVGLPECSALMASIIDQSPNPTWISDSKGVLIRINRACLDLLKISEAEVLGKYSILEDNIVKEQGLLPLVQRVFEQGETARFEITYDTSGLEALRLHDRASVVLDVTVFPLKDAHGKVTNAVIQHIDVSASRRSEEALQRANAELEQRVRERTAELSAANELFRTLCSAAPIGIFMTDAAGSTIYSNPYLQELLGLPAGEILGWGWSSAVHPEDRAETSERWRQAADLGRTYQHECRVMVHGKPVWIRGLASPYRTPEGVLAGHVGIVEDITEQRHAREEMLKTQKLESLGVLAGGIAHDFNNILSIILGYISLASALADDPEVVMNRLQECERGILRARDLTQQLLTFARGGNPMKKVVQLNRLLRETVEFASLGSQVRCEFRLSQDNLLLSADEGQLGQVVHNLVLNAIQAMPGGGTITVTSEALRAPEGEAMVGFSIRDTGCGIPEELRAKVFDPYFSTKKGSGLGLTSCYSIVRKHGGSITVDSVPGEGTAFTVTLPATTQGAETQQELTADTSGGTGRILFMDDDPLVREVVEAMLRQLGYTVDPVASGEAAVEMYRSSMAAGERYAAAIMDLTVRGGMGGKDTMQALLHLDPSLKGIVCSGYSGDPVMADCRTYGFAAALEKPFSKGELRQALKALLDD